MLAILTSHPIQYQAPLWRALHAADFGSLKVWFLSDHGQRESRDAEFGKSFTWDVDLISGYPHEFLPVKPGSDLRRFRGVQLKQSWDELLRRDSVTDLWIEGWRLKPMWDVVGVARKLGIRVWIRGESNELKRDPLLKWAAKQVVLGRHLRKAARVLCIGSANWRLYRRYGVAEERMALAPYCVDNDQFAAQAAETRARRSEIRARWKIPNDAWCVLFCGKFISKKRPGDMVAAAKQLASRWGTSRRLHLLFVGSGTLGTELRATCQVVYDAYAPGHMEAGQGELPTASFAGFLNQSQIVEAYVAADVLVLPSNWDETWGLVVNEAMACGCPAVVSDQCGCAEDLPAKLNPQLVFQCGDIEDCTRAIQYAMNSQFSPAAVMKVADTHHLRHTVNAVEELYDRLALQT